MKGGPGWLNSVRVLDYVCGKLYSNSTLGTKARSMRPEDLDYKETGATTRYAYYVNGIEGMPETITVNGKVYTCKEHLSATCIFLEYDEGTSGECIETYTTTVNGENYTYRYATPTGDKPVLVTNKSMSGGSKYNGAKAVIGGNYGWLASPYTLFVSSYAEFCVRGANGSSVISGYLEYSYSSGRDRSRGLRPLVTLGSGLQLETTGEGTPGSESNPWRITK